MIVVLVGFMGAGKTTVGHILAERLGLPFVDSDVLIEQRLGRAIKDIFETEGEGFFRELEHQTVTGLVRGQDAVLALGGGALGDARTRAALRNARVVYLRVGYGEAMERVQNDQFRPMLRRRDLENVYQTRLPVYEGASAFNVDTNGRRPDEVAREVLELLTTLPELPAGSSSVFVAPVGGTYYSHIGPGLLDHVADLIPAMPDAEQAVVIEARSDRAVADRAAAQLASTGLRVSRIPVADGQSAKTLSAFEQVAERLADVAIHKGDLVVAVGGEPVCELAGFVAATFNRGMRLALIPTTLVAQADSAVGGKNALNLRQGHNLVGTIHQPMVVISDVRVAGENARAGYESGLAEIAKHALISPSDLLQFVHDHAKDLREGDSDLLRVAVTRSIEIKADIVSRDERDQGDRIFLNYGHTFAHAMELAYSSSGQESDCLSLGLMAAAYLAHRQGRIEADVVRVHRDLLTALGLPVVGDFPFTQMREPWLRDKKYRRGVRFVVLNGLGQPEGGVTADENTLTAVLNDLARGFLD
jgi:shikimate kinase/3-dehydroquinate synthase